MSVLYSIIPIHRDDEEYMQQLNKWLAEFGIRLPNGVASRYPTPFEIRQVLDELAEYTKKYHITETVWDVDIYETALYDQEHHTIGGKHTTIYSIGPGLNENLPLHIYFRSGLEELNLEIVLRLTRFTGPLLLTDDSDAVPVLVSPGEKLPDLITQWRKNRDYADHF